LGHSLIGAGPIIIHRMSPDGRTLLDSGVTVYTGPVAEGTKIYKRNKYYYISIPEGGVGAGWQTVLRSKRIWGPYEKKVVLEQGTTAVNGPHQGSLVETPGGQLWFYHFQLAGATGRVVHLQPGYWKDDWPVIGVDIDRDGMGQPVYVWKKPDVGKTVAIAAPQSDDNFESPNLGLQWQWNHNPVDSGWSLTRRHGWLALAALHTTDFMHARNTLTQKTMGTKGQASVELDGDNLAEGQKAGLSSLSSVFNQIGLEKKNGRLWLFCQINDRPLQEAPVTTKKVFLRVNLDTTARASNFAYSLDNKKFTPFGQPFDLVWGFWKGTRIALFSYNVQTSGGVAWFRHFRYDYDGPKGAE
jgi:beta-xylosidase